ncbi:MAG: hypothetical protein FXF47_08965 [Candidatus Mcinerneyibacterium aminivorans]|uniref:Uncharacterized protein n=1 Tax=Candidatus Mcinerneyibacterium aminivorans TaxID=2703815 RepID=A0A5D0MBV4_9BACT|nr:MAG: hypothetical protein FXF47_08965 [Candidatus Mcinerneyibacterium aminivorans]
MIRYYTFGNIFLILYFVISKALKDKIKKRYHNFVIIFTVYLFSTFLSLMVLRYWFWFVFGRRFILHSFVNNLIIVLAVASIYLIYKYLKNELQETREAKIRLETENKLKLLRSKVDPHFLSNSLTAISELAFQNNTDKIDKVTYELSHLYRNILDITGKKLITLKEELDNLEYYLDINKLIYGDVFDYEFKVDDDHLENKVLPFMIQIPVENSIKYGVRNLENRKGKIKVEIKKFNDKLLIVVMDNGKGFDEKDLEKSSSFGINSIKKRMELYFNEYSFIIKNREKFGVKVEMEIPYGI